MSGGVIAGRTSHILEYEEYNIDNLNFSDVDVRCVEMPMSRSLDIDTIEDFQHMELILINSKEG